MITQDLIDRFNRYQMDGRFHPLTCCGGDENTPNCKRNKSYNDRREGKDVPYTPENEGILIATLDGWVCPCGDYKEIIK